LALVIAARRALAALILLAGFLVPCLTWPNGSLWGGWLAALLVIGSIGAGLVLAALVMPDD
jgi:hypothetical protein